MREEGEEGGGWGLVGLQFTYDYSWAGLISIEFTYDSSWKGWKFSKFIMIITILTESLFIEAAETRTRTAHGDNVS